MLELIIGFLGTAFIGVFGWITHLGNRVSILETERKNIADLIELRFHEVNRRLDRLEYLINGHKPKTREE